MSPAEAPKSFAILSGDTRFQLRHTNSCIRSGKWRAAIGAGEGPCGMAAFPATPWPIPEETMVHRHAVPEQGS